MSGTHDERDCHGLCEQLSEYLDGELDPEICAQLERHLNDCPPCESFLESLRRAVELTRSLSVRKLPEDLEEQVIAAYRKAREAGEG